MRSMLLACWMSLFSADCFSQQDPLSKLEPQIVDKLNSDSRTKYQVTGPIDWQVGQLTMSAGAILNRSIGGGQWVQLDVELDKPHTAELGSEAEFRVWFYFDGNAPHCYVQVKTSTKKEQRYIHEVALYCVENGRPVLVSKSSQNTAFKNLNLSYRHGFVRVGSADRMFLKSFVDNDSSSVRSYAVEILEGRVSLEKLETTFHEMSTEDPKLLTASERAYADGDDERAIRLLNEVLEARRSFFGEVHPACSRTLQVLAEIYAQNQEFEKAIEFYTDSIRIREAAVGRMHYSVAFPLSRLAQIQRQCGNDIEAERILKRVVENYGVNLGKDHPEYAIHLVNLASLYEDLGKIDRAEKLLVRALGIVKASLGDTHPQYINILRDLAVHYTFLSRDYSSAESLLKNALRANSLSRGQWNADRVPLLDDLSSLYLEMGNQVAAESCTRELLALVGLVRGQLDPLYVAALERLSSCYKLKGRYRKAIEPMEKAIEFQEHLGGEVLYLKSELARLYGLSGDFLRAERLHKEALDQARSTFGAKHPLMIFYLSELAKMYVASGKYALAEPLFASAYDISEASDTGSPTHAIVLGDMGNLNLAMGRLDVAERFLKESLVINLSALGENSLAHLTSVNNLGHLHSAKKEVEKAREHYEKALEISSSVYGKDNYRNAEILFSLANVHILADEFGLAKQLLESGLAIQAKSVGKNMVYAVALSLTAICDTNLREYSLARTRHLQALELDQTLEKNVESPISRNLIQSSVTMLYSGSSDKAINLIESALAKTGARLGENHPEFANFQASLAYALMFKGEFAKAEKLSNDALSKFVDGNHTDSEGYFHALMNLGVCSMRLGNFRKANASLQRALEIADSQNERIDHRIDCLAELGSLYLETGRFEEAYKYLVRARSQIDTRGSSRNPSRITTILKLASIEVYTGDLHEVERLSAQAAKMVTQVKPNRGYQYVYNLVLLSEVMRAIEEYSEALEYAQEAAALVHIDSPLRPAVLNAQIVALHGLGEIKEAARLTEELGKLLRSGVGGTVDHVRSLVLAALVQSATGELKNARLTIEQCKQAVSNFNSEAPELPDLLTFGALVEFAIGDFAAARERLDVANDMSLRRLEDLALMQSEREQLLATESFRAPLDFYLSGLWQLSADAARHNLIDQASNTFMGPQGVNGVLERIWKWQGSVTLRQQAIRRASNVPNLNGKSRELQAVSRALSAHAGRVPMSNSRFSEADVLGWAQRFRELQALREDLEKELANANASYQRQQKPLSVNYIQSLIPENGIYIDLVLYKHSELNASGLRLDVAPQPRYMAFVLSKEAGAEMIRIGTAEEINGLVKDFRVFLGGESRDQVRSQKASVERVAELKQKLWKPLEDHLEGIETIVISADSELGTLPFCALPGKRDGTFLIEDFRFVTLSTPGMFRTLIDVEQGNREGKKGLLVVGDVNYDAKPSMVVGQPNATSVSQRLAWKKLPGFEDELRLVVARFKERFDAPITILRGDEATESAFLNEAQLNRNLHLVTHGFFASPNIKDSRTAVSFMQNLAFIARPRLGINKEIEQYQPGLLSGLVFAGANNFHNTVSSNSDGILTASEITVRDLTAVDLVVLSACETSLGKSTFGEGLAGLQRALHISGARSCVSSLWKVDDSATQELMSRFYSNRWEKGQSKLDALRNAQLSLLNTQDSQASSRRGLGRDKVRVDSTASSADQNVERLHPRYWAAFQLSGDWR